MIPEIKHLYVNWIDGMKINKNHFLNSDLANIDSVRDALAFQLNEFSGSEHPLLCKFKI